MYQVDGLNFFLNSDSLKCALSYHGLTVHIVRLYLDGIDNSKRKISSKKTEKLRMSSVTEKVTNMRKILT